MCVVKNLGLNSNSTVCLFGELEKCVNLSELQRMVRIKRIMYVKPLQYPAHSNRLSKLTDAVKNA